LLMFCISRVNNKPQPIQGLAALCRAFGRTFYQHLFLTNSICELSQILIQILFKYLFIFFEYFHTFRGN